MSDAFMVDGRRSYRVIAALILLIGTLMFAGGLIMTKEGNRKLTELAPIAKRVNGRVTRVFVPDERKVTNNSVAELKAVVAYGGMARKYAWFIVIPGVLFLIQPIFLFDVMRFLRIDKRIA